MRSRILRIAVPACLAGCLLILGLAGPGHGGEFAEKVVSGADLTLGDFFEAGGQIMWVLLLLSVLAVGTAAYLAAVLRESVVAPPAQAEELLDLLRKGQADAAAGLVTAGGSSLARIARAGFRRAESGSKEIGRAVEAAGRREAAHFRTIVGYLSDVGVIAPMLGLLGTVIGMIQSFGSIAGEEIRVVPLAAAIMKAMVTTAFGLMVGIIAMALYYFFRGRLAAVAAELETNSEEIASLIAIAPVWKPGGATAPAADAETIPDVTEIAEEVTPEPDAETPPEPEADAETGAAETGAAETGAAETDAADADAKDKPKKKSGRKSKKKTDDKGEDD